MSSDRSAIRLVRDDDALALGVCQSPARLLAARLRRGELSATEVVNAHLERIASHNPALNAVVSLDAARARADAERLDRAFQRGEPRGPLHGVPITLKDGHDVAGLRTTIGAHQFDRVARDDGTIAARLRAAGAIILGHTNVPPGLSDFQSANSIFGRTSNPWDLSRTAGGSSGGAAAAVAAGLTTLDVGSDLAGSMRLPAHFCGVYALKATEHRIPSTGFFRLRQDSSRPIRIFASFGPITRDLDDLELVLRLIAGPDGKDSDVPPVALPPRERLSMKRLRLAIAAELPGVTVSPSVRSRVLSVATASWDAGATTREALPAIHWESSARLFGELVGEITSVFQPGHASRDLAWYLDALWRRDRVIAAWDQFFEAVDALIIPAAIRSAIPHCETGAPIDVAGKPVNYWEMPACLTPINLAGLPALVVPAGTDADGLPIAIQIVGSRWSEMRLLDIARALEYEGILPGFRPPPLS